MSPVFEPDDLIKDRFRIERLLGSGREGEVFVALDEKMGSRVCVKVLQPRCSEKDARERSAQEARLMRRIDSPHVVKVHDVDWYKDRAYLVMPVLTGMTLRERLEKGRLEADEAEYILRGLLQGLEAAHREGILHRDISPANVFLKKDSSHPMQWPCPVILDLGVDSKGTSGYIAPELESGGTPGNASDIYSVGILAYEMLTGRRPTNGCKSLHETCLLYTSPSPRDATLSRMPSSA